MKPASIPKILLHPYAATVSALLLLLLNGLIFYRHFHSLSAFDCVPQVKHAMTMTEKILARASERGTVAPGENVWVKADMLMTHDVCGPGTIGIFHKEFGRDAKVNRPASH